MPHAAPGGAGADEVAADDLVLVNEARSVREVHLRVARDGAVRAERVVVREGELAAVAPPDGSGALSIEVDTDHGEHASLTAAGSSLVVVRDRSVLVTD